MSDPDPAEITRHLHALGRGDPGAADALAPLVYRQLHNLAERALNNESPGHTLQPTALVHEAFLLLFGQRSVEWQSRTHFYSMAAKLMRRILVDHARRRLAKKRGGGLNVSLADGLVGGDGESEERILDIIEIDRAMASLEALEPRAARVVELRYFAGMDAEETARALDISTATVTRDTAFARAFLRRELAARGGAG